MVKDIVIVGAGGLAQEVLWTINCINAVKPTWNVIAFASEVKTQVGEKHFGRCIIHPSEIRSENVVLGFADPQGKKRFVEKHKKYMFRYPNIVHPDVILGMGASLGANGVVVFARTTLMPYSTLADYTQVNTGVVIGHNAVIGQYNTISPGALVMGNCKTGECTYIGVGACTREKISIGNNCIIGAGAAVVDNIPDNSMAVGVPAKVIKKVKQ